jgi:hypothetical protein
MGAVDTGHYLWRPLSLLQGKNQAQQRRLLILLPITTMEVAAKRRRTNGSRMCACVVSAAMHGQDFCGVVGQEGNEVAVPAGGGGACNGAEDMIYVSTRTRIHMDMHRTRTHTHTHTRSLACSHPRAHTHVHVKRMQARARMCMYYSGCQSHHRTHVWV